MKEKNIKALESISLYGHYCGILSVFLGLIATFISIMNDDMRHVLVGIYVFASGYAFAKLSQRISRIVYDEKL